MKHDIFIDNNVAKNFAYPLDPHYKDLVAWLFQFDKKRGDLNAHLAVSNKLLGEYISSSGECNSGTAIPVLINKLLSEGRIIKVSNAQIKSFKQVYFTKKVNKKLRSNSKDREHIPVILLSNRKIAITIDDNFLHDVLNFPGFNVTAAKRPEKIKYA